MEGLLRQVNGSIKATFKIYHHKRPQSPQIVHILGDHTFVCSCLLSVNAGYPCRHYFALLKERVVKFHISIINPRWFVSALNPTTLSKHRTLEAHHPGITSCFTPSKQVQLPMSDVLTVRRNKPSPTGPKKQRFSRLVSLSRNVADFVSDSPTKSATWEDLFQKAQHINIDRLKLFLECEETAGKKPENRPTIANPPLIKTKGRPRAKRYKSSVEVNVKRKRKRGMESPGSTPENQVVKIQKFS